VVVVIWGREGVNTFWAAAAALCISSSLTAYTSQCLQSGPAQPGPDRVIGSEAHELARAGRRPEDGTLQRPG
jgi:hypothetical protein